MKYFSIIFNLYYIFGAEAIPTSELFDSNAWKIENQ